MGWGLPSDLFWTSTLREVEAVILRKVDQQRAANLRAGLIAATLVNIFRKKGARLVSPSDFLDTPRDHMTIKEAGKFLDGLVASHSKLTAPQARRGKSIP